MKQTVDIIIISNAKTTELKEITEYAINTLYNSEENIIFKCYVVESSDADFSQMNENITMIKPTGTFGYHRYLNQGLDYCKSKYVCLCNNDLEFHKNWASNIIKEMETDISLLSASPLSYSIQQERFGIRPNSGNKYGYKLWENLSGWCIFQQRSIYNQISLDEQFEFWYCDNDYLEDLKSKNIKQALITSSQVNHIVSKTLDTMSVEEKKRLTQMQQKIFNDKWKK